MRELCYSSVKNTHLLIFVYLQTRVNAARRSLVPIAVTTETCEYVIARYSKILQPIGTDVNGRKIKETSCIK